jgi:hypothetical protein
VINFMKEQMFCEGDPTRRKFKSSILQNTQIVN